MAKIDKTVRDETLYVALWVALLSVVMQAVFLIIGHWSLGVLFGNMLTAAVSIGNFLLLGLTVQKAVCKTDEKEAKNLMKLSQVYRFFLIFVIVVIGVVLPDSVFHPVALLIPLLFPRIAIAIRAFALKRTKKEDEKNDE